MSGPLRSDDDDPRPQQMTEDPDRYFGEAWERSRQEVLAERSGQSSTSTVSGTAATLAPGIVEMSLRGDEQDVERLVASMRAKGLVMFRADSAGTKDGNRAGYRYFSVEVPRDADG